MALSGFVIGVGYVVCDHMLAVTLLTVGWAFSGLIEVGHYVSTLDMSPQHAGLYFLYTSTVIDAARGQGPDFRKILTPSYDNLRIFVQYTLILRLIYDITTIVRSYEHS